MFAFDGATVTTTRPHGLLGNPADEEISLQFAPPSVDLYRPLPLGALGPSPPERNVQPLRRKSHSPAKIVFGFLGSSVNIEHPVERFDPLSTWTHVLPPSVVL